MGCLRMCSVFPFMSSTVIKLAEISINGYHYFPSFFAVEFPQALMKLLKNPVYMLLNLATVFEMVIVTGFITFIPKYLETQFDLRTSEANLYTGKF